MSNKLNGSVERLAEALRDVVREGATEAVEPLRNELREVREDVRAVEERLNTRIDGVANDVRNVEERLGNRIDRAIEDIVAERQRATDA